MPNYVALIRWADQGVRNVKDTVSRYRDARTAFEREGVKFQSIRWVTGPCDIVALVEAPDDEALLATVLKLAGQGNLRTETYRACDEPEMEKFLKRIG